MTQDYLNYLANQVTHKVGQDVYIHCPDIEHSATCRVTFNDSSFGMVIKLKWLEEAEDAVAWLAQRVRDYYEQKG